MEPGSVKDRRCPRRASPESSALLFRSQPWRRRARGAAPRPRSTSWARSGESSVDATSLIRGLYRLLALARVGRRGEAAHRATAVGLSVAEAVGSDAILRH